MRCEPEELEDCVNCSTDCGMCELNACSESLMCVFGCFNFGGGGIPSFSLSCLSGCVAQTCPDSRVFLDEVVSCAIGAFAGGGCRDISCLTTECRGPITRCLTDTTCD